MSDLATKARALADAITVTLDALSVFMVAAEELADTAAEWGKDPASEAQLRQIAALRKLFKQPSIDGLAITAAQADHEVTYWTAEAERRPATAEQLRALGELAAALALDGIAVQVADRLSLAGYVRERRRLNALRSRHAPAAAK